MRLILLDKSLVKVSLLGQTGWGMMEGSENHPCYCSFAYSALASFRIGMSASASFQTLKKS